MFGIDYACLSDAKIVNIYRNDKIQYINTIQQILCNLVKNDDNLYFLIIFDRGTLRLDSFLFIAQIERCHLRQMM